MNTVKFHIIVCASSVLALIAFPSCKNHRDSSKNNSQSFLDSAVFENVDSIANLEEVDFSDLEEDDEMALQSEVDILGQLDHPNVVKLFEIFDEGDFLYLVMELMIGGEVLAISLKMCSCLIESSRRSIIQRRRLLTRLDP